MRKRVFRHNRKLDNGKIIQKELEIIHSTGSEASEISLVENSSHFFFYYGLRDVRKEPYLK